MMGPSKFHFLSCLSLGSLVSFANAYVNPYSDLMTFHSRPDLNPPKITISNRNGSTPGYLFLAPWADEGKTETGPYIYDSQTGDLIWSGADGVGSVGNSHGIRPCDYKGAKHLCFFESKAGGSHSGGHGTIVDYRYRTVAKIHSGKAQIASEFHEFHVLPGGKSALVTIFEPTPADLSPYKVGHGLGWILDGGFQEIDTETGNVNFHWRSMDHVEPFESTYEPGGRRRNDPWDFFHINSLDRSKDGHYLVSARHMSCIYLISKHDGSILWRLGGPQTSFNQTNFHFGFQHHVRFREQSDDRTIISFFNNGYDGRHKAVTKQSSGMIVELDHLTNQAKMIHQYEAPKTPMSSSQGSLEYVPNSDNVVIDWGDNKLITEHERGGRRVMEAKLANGHANSYRVYKGNWVGYPLDEPALWSYSQTHTSQTVQYVSWNGATEVKYWRFHTSENKHDRSSFVPTHLFHKTGFETRVILPSYHSFTFVEGLNSDLTSLGNSSIKETFVPGPMLVNYCNKTECPSEAVKIEVPFGPHSLELPSSTTTSTTTLTKTPTPMPNPAKQTPVPGSPIQQNPQQNGKTNNKAKENTNKTSTSNSNSNNKSSTQKYRPMNSPVIHDSHVGKIDVSSDPSSVDLSESSKSEQGDGGKGNEGGKGFSVPDHKSEKKLGEQNSPLKHSTSSTSTSSSPTPASPKPNSKGVHEESFHFDKSKSTHQPPSLQKGDHSSPAKKPEQPKEPVKPEDKWRKVTSSPTGSHDPASEDEQDDMSRLTNTLGVSVDDVIHKGTFSMKSGKGPRIKRSRMFRGMG